MINNEPEKCKELKWFEVEKLPENHVLNMLNIVFDNVPNYFTFDRCEIDFVIQNKIISIEVKSGKFVNNTSLTRYNDKFSNDISIRFSLNNLKFT